MAILNSKFCLNNHPTHQKHTHKMVDLASLFTYSNVLDGATAGVSSVLIYSGVVGVYIDPLGCNLF
ncbi:hypothetical protein V1525DRAFT_393041 [Lipomyces kononenkoae]|uniref:Uncharacterized protein n=1 Tax=Lipomyces kononenkoae TaxID=34357 RepID=A0ACC3TBS1_LIPKO